MVGWKNLLLVSTLLIMLVLGVYYSQKRLDKLHPQQGFQEFMYLPNGRALQIVALGFRAPLADCLYIKSLIYWSENANAIKKKNRAARFRFLYKAIDAVTDLSPYFKTAYINGGLLVSAANKPKEAMLIFKKGIKRMPQTWQLYMHMAALALMQLDDREFAKEQYKLGAKCKGVPRAIIGAWRGLVQDDIEQKTVDPIKKYEVLIATWLETLKDEDISKELGDYAQDDLARLRTECLTFLLTRKYRQYLQTHAVRPSIQVLADAGELESLTLEYLADFPYFKGDKLSVKSDGQVMSMYLLERSIRVLKYNSRAEAGKKKNFMLERLRTLSLMLNFTIASKKFLVTRKRLPQLKEIMTSQYLKPEVMQEIADYPFLKGDTPASLPDGTMVSMKLIELEVENIQKIVRQKLNDFRKKEKRQAQNLDELVAEGFLDYLPRHPLAEVGYGLRYNITKNNLDVIRPK